MSVPDVKRLKEPEDENGELKKLLVEQMLDVVVLKELLAKKMIGPVVKREAVAHLQAKLGLSERPLPGR